MFFGRPYWKGVGMEISEQLSYEALITREPPTQQGVLASPARARKAGSSGSGGKVIEHHSAMTHSEAALEDSDTAFSREVWKAFCPGDLVFVEPDSDTPQPTNVAPSIPETATPADHVPGKARLCSYHAAAARKSNPATSPTTASSALSSFQTDLSEPLRQAAVYLALTTC